MPPVKKTSGPSKRTWGSKNNPPKNSVIPELKKTVPFPSPNLASYSEVDLRAELTRREVEREKARIKAEEDRAEFLLAHVEELLALCPDHLNGCTDEDMQLETGCVRCQVLESKHMGFWPRNIELKISVSSPNWVL